MVKNRVLYASICILTIYVGLLYYSEALLGLFLVELCIPVISFVLLAIEMKKLKIRSYVPIGVIEKGQLAKAGIEIESNSRIPIFSVWLKLSMKNQFYESEEMTEILGMADGKAKTRIIVKFSSEHCGFLHLAYPEVKVYDLFRLFSRKIKVNDKAMVAVLPEYYCAHVVLSEKICDFITESEEYDKNHPGDDPSEVFQSREYRPGDRMQSIHWKLSARTDDLMVKEYSLPIGNDVIVFWDMSCDFQKNYGYLDEWIEAGLAVSQGLLEAGCEHYVVWFDRNRQDIERIEIVHPEDICLLTEKIFACGPYTEDVLLEELYKEKFRGETWHTQLCINLKKELWENDELCIQLKENARLILENGIIL